MIGAFGARPPNGLDLERRRLYCKAPNPFLPVAGRTMQHRLPLNHLEHFFLWDDRPGYRNVLACRMTGVGRFDHSVVERALAMLAERHPLIASRLETDRRGRGTWVIGSAPPKVEFVTCDGFDEPPVFEPMDLERDGGARVLVRESGDRSELWFLSHHACCDGLGGMQCIGDLLVLCDNLSRGRPTNRGLRTIDPSLLEKRSRFFRTRLDAIRHLPLEAIGLYGAYKFFRHQPLPLASSAPPDRSDTEGSDRPRCLTFGLDPEQTERLAASAESRRSTVNGVLTRDLLEALLAWSRERGIEPRPKQPLRLFVPMNVRDFADRRLSAANRVSLVYLDRRAAEIASRPGLLGSVNFEMRAIQNWRLGSTFQWFLKALGPFPGLLRGWLDRPVCRASALFTNLGDFYQRLPLEREGDGVRVGSVRIEQLELLAPIRPLTPLAISAFRFADRQQLSIRYDGSVFGIDEMRRLADLIRVSLERSLEPRPVPTSGG
ncbi:MAG TPA: hypothetical protein PLI18_05680 [Pirellulaceae bacterium]|nr:hypothetical protein [Pirellulaceae bacterium]